MSSSTGKFWQIGGARVWSLVEANPEVALDFIVGLEAELLQAQDDWLGPCFVADDKIRLAVQSFLIESRGKRIVVDTCLGHASDEPDASPFLTALEGMRFGRSDVDLVLCTHLHRDHVGWNTVLEGDEWVPTFRSARYLVSRDEHEFWQTHPHPHVDLTDNIGPIIEAEALDGAVAGTKLTDDVRLVATPGHTPNHMSVHIESQGAAAVISGDVLHHPIQVALPDLCSTADWDQRKAREIRCRMLDELAGTETLLFGTHFAGAGAGRVFAGREGFRIDWVTGEAA